MGLPRHESDTHEETTTHRIFFLSRRGLLCALVLCGLLLLMSVTGMHRASWVGARLALWALFIWSLVSLFYTGASCLHARKFATQKLSDRGLTDMLTGLPNRKGLIANLEQHDLGTQEFGKRVRLIDVDLMNLDKVNYEFGQLLGDAVLQDIANLLRATVPEDDMVGRLGGDEFLVILPRASTSEAESLADGINQAIADYRLNLGDRGEVHSIKAKVSMAAYVPERASLHETVVSAKEASAYAKLPEMTEGEAPPCYHVSRVTLGAFAVHHWQSLSKTEHDEFKVWKREFTTEFTERMAGDIVKLLDEKAETGYADFVTAVPAPGGAGGGRTYPARQLAETVAQLLGIPYREVIRAEAVGAETRSVEPTVDTVITKGTGALLISDIISSGILERRCVKKLAAAGAHVLLISWAAY